MKLKTKKALAILLIITALLSQVSCGSGKSASLTMGQWLNMICESFGMQDYLEEKPFFKSVSRNNPYFSACQAAAEWDVIDTKEDLNVNAPLTWKQALLTLMNVGRFVDLESSDDDKIKAAIEKFDSSIRTYWMDRTIPTNKAVQYLDQAMREWANKSFDKNVEEIDYKEDVKDFSKVVDQKDYEVDPENNTVKLNYADVDTVKPGDVYVLPAEQGNLSVTAFKADSVEKVGNQLVIKNSDQELTLEDVVENLFVEESYAPEAENMVIYDPNGNVIHMGSNVAQSMSSETLRKIHTSPSGFIMPVKARKTSAKVSKTFELGDWEVSLEYNINGKFNLGFKVETPNILTAKYQKAHPSQELKVSFGASIDSLKVTNEIDYKWFKLRSASLRVDYEQKVFGGVTFSGKPVNKTFAPEKQNYSYGNILGNWKNSIWKDVDSDDFKGAKTIKICSVDIWSVGVARVCIDVNVSVSVEGSITVTLTMRGAKGIEYSGGKTRLINVTDKDLDVDLKAKVEVTGAVGPALYALGLKKPIIGVQVRAGFGAQADVKFNVGDNEGHLIESMDNTGFNAEFADYLTGAEAECDVEVIKQAAAAQGATYDKIESGQFKLHLDVCIDVTVYFILRLEITDTSYINDIAGGKIKTSWEIFGFKNAKLLNIHWDNGGPIQFGYPGHPVTCSLQYVPFESIIPESTDVDGSTEVQDNPDVVRGIKLDVNEYQATVQFGTHYYIQLTEIPDGYKTSDLICSSADESIATVTNDGVVTPHAIGSTVITIATKDNKHSVAIAIVVSDLPPSQIK